jgi:hypothetical protein
MNTYKATGWNGDTTLTERADGMYTRTTVYCGRTITEQLTAAQANELRAWWRAEGFEQE